MQMKMLEQDMKIDTETGGPRSSSFIPIPQEEFVDSVAGGSGDEHCRRRGVSDGTFNEKGIKTIHDTGVYDIIDGQLDRSMAYDYSEAAVRKILEENPSIEVPLTFTGTASRKIPVLSRR